MASYSADDGPETHDPLDMPIPADKRTSGSIAGVLAALTLLALFAIGAFWVIGAEQPETTVTAQKAAAGPEGGKAATRAPPAPSENAARP